MSSQIKNLYLDKKWFYGSHGYTDKLVNFFFKASRSDILPFSDVFILYDISNTARRDGRVIKEARRSWRSSILDCTTDAESAEQLRQRVMGHVLLKESANISIDNWHSGWKTGEVLRYAPGNDSARHKIHSHISRESGETGRALQQVQQSVYLELSRKISRHILREAFSMGFDGLIGAVPDSGGHFLAAFNTLAVEKPPMK